MNLKGVLERLYSKEILSRGEARDVLIDIAGNSCDPFQVAAFLSVYNIRRITIDEFAGFREAMMELCIPVDLQSERVMDLCGTGGDGRDTFNISTLSSLVVAAAGAKVAKHGNKSVSSKCGSSNVLQHLGVHFKNRPSQLLRDVETNNICILHAPLFHPAMKNMAPIRKALGVKTFFNMLGPLVNPSDPQTQLTGVFSAEVARLYYYLLLDTNKSFSVIYDLNGYDEVSLTGPVKVFSRKGEQVLYPVDFGLDQCRPEELFGGDDVPSSANIFLKVLEGKGTKAQTNTVLANAGLALSTYHDVGVKEGVEAARSALKSGKALNILQKMKDQ